MHFLRSESDEIIPQWTESLSSSKGSIVLNLVFVSLQYVHSAGVIHRVRDFSFKILDNQSDCQVKLILICLLSWIVWESLRYAANVPCIKATFDPFCTVN